MTVNDKINFLLDALEDGETNFQFDENKFGQRKINRTLNRIKNIYAKSNDAVRKEMEENESTTWQRMIRVLSHEILNTVAPIASLSQTLKNVQGAELNIGLDTISASAEGLIKFVNSYHSLTHSAQPIRKSFYVKDMAAKVIELTKFYGIPVNFQERSDDVLLYADEEQISQIMLNLVKNAVEADATRINIYTQIDPQDNVIIHVSNNGKPISNANQDAIFDPFFTTKPSGSGIGLSLSRQIMRRHGGSLTLTSSDNYATIFTLTFP